MSNNEIERSYTIEDLEELLDNLPYEIYIKNINGKYKYVNKTAIERAGLKKEEIINKNDFEIRSYNKAKICVESDGEVINSGDKTYIENETYIDNVETNYEIFKTLLFKDNKEKVMIGGISKFNIDNDNFVKDSINNISNLDQYNKEINKNNSTLCFEALNREIKLKVEAQNKLQMIIDNIIDVYAILKKVDDKLIWLEISKRCEEIIGWNISELNYGEDLHFIHPKDKRKIKNIVQKNKKAFLNTSFTMKTKDKKWLNIDAKIKKISDDIYMIVAQDNTKLIELKKNTDNLKQVIELESLKSEFFANISHEFKTPLNIILSTVQLITSYMNINNTYPSIEQFNKYMKSIKQNSYRLLKLANNMIDTTKIDGDFYQININNYNIVEIVENIVQSLASYIKNSKRNIIFDTVEEEIILACDPDQIERVILNLLSNAMKFTSEDGNIYVSIESNEPFNKVLIRIGNDGHPLDIKDSEKIFKRFTQSESLLTRRIEGSGIGLSISKSLIEMHKGDIYVNTKVKKGAEFCIELPIRKVMNNKEINVREKNIIAKIEKLHIEFSDIYDLDNNNIKN